VPEMQIGRSIQARWRYASLEVALEADSGHDVVESPSFRTAEVIPPGQRSVRRTCHRTHRPGLVLLSQTGRALSRIHARPSLRQREMTSWTYRAPNSGYADPQSGHLDVSLFHHWPRRGGCSTDRKGSRPCENEECKRMRCPSPMCWSLD